MTVWRLVPDRYARVAFDGGGGLVAAGRWHDAGHRVAYAAEHAALAVLEKLVWIDDYRAALDASFSLVPLSFEPERHLRIVRVDALPTGWDAPVHSSATRRMGTQWLREMDTPVLAVPSVLLPTAHNYLVNPLHPDVDALAVGSAVAFRWDERLFRGPF